MNRLNFLYITCFATALLFAGACRNDKPRGVMSEEKMKSVLWDLALAGEYVNGYVYYQFPTQNRAAINTDLLKEIYRVHHINKKEFDKSLEYYKTKPKILMAMLDSIAAKHSEPATDAPMEGNPAADYQPSLITSPGSVK